MHRSSFFCYAIVRWNDIRWIQRSFHWKFVIIARLIGVTENMSNSFQSVGNIHYVFYWKFLIINFNSNSGASVMFVNGFVTKDAVWTEVTLRFAYSLFTLMCIIYTAHINTPREIEREELPMGHNSRDRYTAQLLGILRSFMKAIK